MEFFRQNKGRLQMCLPVDPDLCGNLEIQGKLKKILPDLEDGDERVDTCVDNFSLPQVAGGELQVDSSHDR